MKKIFTQVVTLALTVALASGLAGVPLRVDAAKKSNPIKACDNYIIYYGYKFNSTVINKLKTYDLVVINPLEHDADSAREKLQAEGIKVYAYTSSIEIPSYDDELVAAVKDSEKLKINNKIITHWGSNELGDLRKSSYRNKVVAKVTERIGTAGYDGVFVDTLDDLENMPDILDENGVELSAAEETALVNDLEAAGVKFLKKIKTDNPNLSIIQNRGFHLLDKGSDALVDSIVYEDICRGDDVEYFEYMKEILDRYTDDHNGVVMALANQKAYYKESKSLAKKYLWLYYQTTNYQSTSIVDGSKYKIDIDSSDK